MIMALQGPKNTKNEDTRKDIGSVLLDYSLSFGFWVLEQWLKNVHLRK